MVVNDFHLVRVCPFPAEAQTPLIIDPDAVLTGTGTLQGFQSVAWRGAKVVQPARLVQPQQLASGHPLNLRGQPARRFVRE